MFLKSINLKNSEEFLINQKVVKKLYLIFILAKYAANRLLGNYIKAHYATLGYERIARTVDVWSQNSVISKINSSLIESLKNSNEDSDLLREYLKSEEATVYRQEFKSYGIEHQIRLKYPKKDDTKIRQGDLLVLKPNLGEKEKGVILIQYNESLKKFASIFDIINLSKYYRFVLEPSTWGYCDPSILLFLGLCTDVIVQAQNYLDYEYIKSLNSNLIPLRLGAGDWIDSNRFCTGDPNLKKYDIVMVASWQKIKRHKLLFKSLKQLDDVRKVALIGYPCEGRLLEDIIVDAKKFDILERLEFFESIPRQEVAKIIRLSKIGVMLTIREGANKGIYEYLFSNVPVIISSRNIGVNRDHINQYTGLISDDHELSSSINKMIGDFKKYNPRDWALNHTGYQYANNLLNESLKKLAFDNDEQWTQDIFMKKNDTNAVYVLEKQRELADEAIIDLKRFLR